MRVLFVEDEDDWFAEVAAELKALDNSVSVVRARSRASAVSYIEAEDEEFDFIICDLRIPPSDGGIVGDENQGLFVQTRAREVRPGVPCMFLTAHATMRNIRDSLSSGGTEDIFGTREPFRMVVHFSKVELPEAMMWVSEFTKKRSELRAIVVDHETRMLLSDHVQLGLQIFARRHEGSRVQIQPLGGGLSGAETYRATVHGPTGVTASVFTKFDRRSAIVSEHEQYNRCLPTLLGPTSFASHADQIIAGLGSNGAVFYQLATGFDRSLFGLIADNDEAAGLTVAKLHQKVDPWHAMRESSQRRIGDFRQEAVPDSVLTQYEDELGALDYRAFEESMISVSACYQHGDLHGANVLVDSLGEPLMIDFGNLGLASACLDPIVLELSILFHPQGSGAIGEWATAEMAEHWCAVDTWARASPVPEFVRACRHWASAVAANELEWLCVAYREALRQLKYPDTRKDLAIAIAISAGREECASPRDRAELTLRARPPDDQVTGRRQSRDRGHSASAFSKSAAPRCSITLSFHVSAE